jgi:hypothetical protein
LFFIDLNHFNCLLNSLAESYRISYLSPYQISFGSGHFNSPIA